MNDDKEQKEMLLTIIKSEARLNNDIAEIISRSNPVEVAKNTPELFEQFETSSYELLTILGIPSHKLFNDKNNPSEDDIKKLDKSSNTLGYFRKRPQSELYEFYIRKTKLLNKLSKSKSISSVNVGLTTRIRNIEHATRFLNMRLK